MEITNLEIDQLVALLGKLGRAGREGRLALSSAINENARNNEAAHVDVCEGLSQMEALDHEYN